MKYKYTYKNSTFDFWSLSLYLIYGSVAGVCNIIFTVSIILLTMKLWEPSGILVRLLLIFGCILFPFLQPIAIYTRAKKQAKFSKTIDISFDDHGVHVKTEGQNSELKWKRIKRIAKKPNMMIIFTTTKHGFLLPNKITGNEREPLYSYVAAKMHR